MRLLDLTSFCWTATPLKPLIMRLCKIQSSPNNSFNRGHSIGAWQGGWFWSLRVSGKHWPWKGTSKAKCLKFWKFIDDGGSPNLLFVLPLRLKSQMDIVGSTRIGGVQRYIMWQCGIRQMHSITHTNIINNLDKYILGKYSKMRTSKFCGYRHEALGPLPLRVQFCGQKLTPIFLEIESMIAKTNFTLGPIEKSIFFVQL